jgi:hypothetical protein
MISLIIAFILFVVAVAAYAICDLDDHGKLRWDSEDYYGFWGKLSDYRKYKLVGTYDEIIRETHFRPEKAPKNWYYKNWFWTIKYKERWLTSTNLTVFLTDGWHLMQFVFINSLLLGFAMLAHNTLLWFVVFRTIWAIVFNISYNKLFSK